MTLQEIKEAIAEMKRRYGIAYSDYHEEEAEGEVKFVDFKIRFKVEKKEKTCIS